MEPQTLVWVKVDAYPWWPAVVVDHTSSGVALEDGKTNLVQFLYTNDAGFVNCNDASEVAMFDLSSDGDKIAASSSDEGCAAAVAEAKALWEQAYQATDLPPAEDHDVEDEGNADVHREATTKEKREKKEKRDKREKREKKDKASRRKDDSDSDEEDERRRRKEARKEMRRAEEMAANNNAKGKAKLERGEEGAHNVMNMVAAQRLASLGSKRTATDKEVRALRAKLEVLTRAHDQHGARAVLSALASIRIDYQQLKSTKIGVAVGALLSGDFPYCRLLAEAILKFWFSQLPLHQKQRLTDENRLERASNASVEGDDEDVAEMSLLHAFGVQIERCFISEEEEVLLEEESAWNRTQRDGGGTQPGDAPSIDGGATLDAQATSDVGVPPPLNKSKPLVPAAHIARVVEEAIGDAPDEMKQFVLNYLSSSDHRQARMDLLRGATTPEAFVTAIQASWNAAMGGGGITAGPVAEDAQAQAAPANTILDETVEDEYPNVSHMFTCKECGAASASTSELVRGGHGEDHIVVTLATCTKCHHSWTIGDE